MSPSSAECRNVRVFGSVARSEANERSDLDLLVEREPGRSLLDHARVWFEDLEELLEMKVHVGTENFRCTGTFAIES